ncbi:MAG: hypothetical protein ABEH89_01325, partial [bacterium]
DEVPEYPDAIEVALRGYDPSGGITPSWYFAIVGFKRHASLPERIMKLKRLAVRFEIGVDSNRSELLGPEEFHYGKPP